MRHFKVIFKHCGWGDKNESFVYLVKYCSVLDTYFVCSCSKLEKTLSILGLFLPFAQSGRALVFAALIALICGHWISIGSALHFTPSHLPRQHLMRSRFAEQNNCSWTLPIFRVNDKDKGYTSHMNPGGPRPGPGNQIKEDYPSHIPVVKTKTEDNQGSMLPRAPVSNWIDPRDIKASLTDQGPPNAQAIESSFR